MPETEGQREPTGPRRLPRGRHALDPEVVLEDQRLRLLAAVPGAVAEHGYEAMSVADIVKRAAVSRNAFYKNFRGKQDCFSAAHERGHERLLQILTGACEGPGSRQQKLERALAAALDTLAAEPELAHLLFVEAPASAGPEVGLLYHQWLRRYGALLHPGDDPVDGDLDEVIVGGIATRIASEVLRGGGEELRDLLPSLVEYLSAFTGSGSRTPGLVAVDSGPAAESGRQRRHRAGA